MYEGGGEREASAGPFESLHHRPRFDAVCNPSLIHPRSRSPLKALQAVLLSEVLEVVDNQLLEELHLEKLNYADGMVLVQRNPSLNMSKYCASLARVLDGQAMIAENKVDCGE